MNPETPRTVREQETFPCYGRARYSSKIIVKFTSMTRGTIIESVDTEEGYTLGSFRNDWIPSAFDVINYSKAIKYNKDLK